MESILLSNIAAIIAKDVLIDDMKSHKTNKLPNNTFPLLSSDSEDEAFQFYLKQKRQKSDNKTKNSSEVPNSSLIKVIESRDARVATSKPWEPGEHQTPLEINLINKFDSIQFENYLHMSKITFLQIFKRLRLYLPKEHYPTAATPQSTFSLSLWKLSSNEHFEDISRKFSITKDVCQQMIRLFWRRISAQYEMFIQWPSTPKKHIYILKGFRAQKQLNKFSQLFGVFATKTLEVFLEAENEERKVVLQIICDSDHKIMDSFLALASDYSFEATPIGQTLSLNGETMPKGCYFIGDESFPLKPYLMRPIGQPNDNREQIFNEAFQPALTLAQRVLDAVAKRFNALYALEARDLDEVRKIVDTICVLHNLCVEMEDDYVETKLQDMQFQWAKVMGDETKKTKAGDDTNVEGRIKRNALMANIIG